MVLSLDLSINLGPFSYMIFAYIFFLHQHTKALDLIIEINKIGQNNILVLGHLTSPPLDFPT